MIRLQLSLEKDLGMAAACKEVFQHAFTQGGFEISGIVDISEAVDVQGILTSWLTRLYSTR